jgi:hypothetical protein
MRGSMTNADELSDVIDIDKAIKELRDWKSAGYKAITVFNMFNAVECGRITLKDLKKYETKYGPMDNNGFSKKIVI